MASVRVPMQAITIKMMVLYYVQMSDLSIKNFIYFFGPNENDQTTVGG